MNSPRKPTALTPIAFVQAIVVAYERRGISPSRALDLAQITPEILENPESRITAWQMERVSGAAMQELDDEALGWFSRRLPWGSYGMLARASISSPQLGLALRRWCRHHGLLTDDITLELAEADGVATLRLLERRDLGRLQEFCTVSVLRNAIGVACWLIDSRIALQSARFRYAAPPHRDAYEVLFPCPQRFDAPVTELTFDARYLALPLRRDEQALQLMLQRALPLMVQPYRRDRLLVARARQLLASQPLQMHNARDLAAALNVSTRTLHRQLHEEGASLQQLKDEVRRARAIDVLLRTDRPLKQVAAACGFLNEKSFIRAFSGWTGTSPAEFRRQQGAAA